jgi:hypothetical protein
MNLKNNFKIFLVFCFGVIFLTSATEIYAQKIPANYTSQLNQTIAKTLGQLDQTQDKDDRMKLIKRLLTLQDAHYNELVRVQKLEKTHPQWAQQVKRDMGLTEQDIDLILKRKFEKRLLLSPYVQSPDRRLWPFLSLQEKTVICEYAVKNCENDRFLTCGFVVERCKPYLPDEVYQDILIRTGGGKNP